MPSPTEQLQSLQQRIDALKTEKIRREQELKSLQTERDQLLEQLKQLGVTDPSKLEEEINKLFSTISAETASIDLQLTQAEQALGVK